MDNTEGSGDFSDAERAAMKDRAAELKKGKRAGRGAAKAAAEEKDCLTTIADMPDPDREIAERLHVVITEAAPELAPRTWYSQPAYAKDGKVICFFRGAAKDDIRYLTLGFSEHAAIDAGSMWATSFAITKLTKTAEREIASLVRKAVA
jgi:uncharacterized protein YdhG (YjbR/CyaY superfamily)